MIIPVLINFIERQQVLMLRARDLLSDRQRVFSSFGERLEKQTKYALTRDARRIRDAARKESVFLSLLFLVKIRLASPSHHV